MARHPFIHVRSKHENALRDRHTRMARLDHRATEDRRSAGPIPRHMRDRGRCLHLVIPSLPATASPGSRRARLNPRVSLAHGRADAALGYTKYVAQGATGVTPSRKTWRCSGTRPDRHPHEYAAGFPPASPRHSRGARRRRQSERPRRIARGTSSPIHKEGLATPSK